MKDDNCKLLWCAWLHTWYSWNVISAIKDCYSYGSRTQFYISRCCHCPSETSVQSVHLRLEMVVGNCKHSPFSVAAHVLVEFGSVCIWHMRSSINGADATRCLWYVAFIRSQSMPDLSSALFIAAQHSTRPSESLVLAKTNLFSTSIPTSFYSSLSTSTAL